MGWQDWTAIAVVVVVVLSIDRAARAAARAADASERAAYALASITATLQEWAKTRERQDEAASIVASDALQAQRDTIEAIDRLSRCIEERDRG